MSWPDSSESLAPLAPWFEAVRRTMPWRALDLGAPHPDPYAVLVSELMLQQTQVATVIPFFLRWMERFPDPAALAAASEDEIHKLWEGLGYYRRARLLQAAAGEIAAKGWPADLAGLLELPGLGPYTAAAVAAIAFQLPEAALDGNAFRVLARLLGIEEDPRKEAPALRAWLGGALSAHGPSRLTQAIMELGATVCAPSSPRCGQCPLSERCEARRRNATDRIPMRQPRPAPREVALWLPAISCQNRWLLHPPGQRGLLAGLWRWPAFALEPLEGAAEAPVPFTLLEVRAWPSWVQVYTHRREHIHPLALDFEQPFPAPETMAWVDAEALADAPMGRRDQRLRELLRVPSASTQEAPPVAGLLRLLRP